MMPDMQQVGEGQPNQEWQKIPEAPAIMVDPNGASQPRDKSKLPLPFKV